MKAPPAVRMFWRDISPHDKTWENRKKVKPDLRVMETVGWIAYEDDDSIVLAQDWDAGAGNFSGCATYPRGCVESLEYLSLSR